MVLHWPQDALFLSFQVNLEAYAWKIRVRKIKYIFEHLYFNNSAPTVGLEPMTTTLKAFQNLYLFHS